MFHSISMCKMCKEGCDALGTITTLKPPMCFNLSNFLKTIFSPFTPVRFVFTVCLHLALGLYKHSQLLMKYGDRCQSFCSRHLCKRLALSKENTSCQRIRLKSTQGGMSGSSLSAVTRSPAFRCTFIFTFGYRLVDVGPVGAGVDTF